MAVIYNDNFDSDTAGVNAPGWTAVTGGWQVGTVAPVSGTQTLSCTTATSAAVNLYTASGYAQADQATSVDFVWAVKTVRQQPAPMVRVTNTSLGGGYMMLIGGSNVNIVDQLIVFKVVNGTYTTLGQAAHGVTLTAGTAYTIELRAVGSTIEGRLYPSGGTRPSAAQVTFTDSTSSAGAPGIYTVFSAGDTAGGYDNFVWTDGTVATAATALTLSALATGTTGVPNTVTVGANGAITGTVTVNLTATNGSYSPASVTISAGSPTATSQYTPASTGSKTLTATDAAAALTAATATQTVSAPSTATFDQTAVLFSPGNWNVGASNAKTINEGAYFKTIFAGTSCTLSFDMTGVSTPVPKITYRVDYLNWVTVDLAATVNITMPTETASLATHHIEVYVSQTTSYSSRWSPQNTAVVLTGITLSTGALSLPPARLLKGLWFGDSILCGVNTLASGSQDTTLRGRAQLSYSFFTSELLGVEFGVCAFGGQGWQKATDPTTGGNVPAFPSTYNLLWGSGPSRSFAGLDFIVINQGQNDSTNSTATQVTTVLNGLIAATDRRTKIIVLEPLSGLQNANIQAGIAACSAPSRVTYINTFTGVTPKWFDSTHSPDAVHPYGYEHLTSVAPKCAAALRQVIQPSEGAAVAQTARTITLTLSDTSGSPRANLSGIKWSIFDQATPDKQTVAIDQGTGATTNSSGVLTLSVFTTLASGANVWLTLSNSDGTITQSPAALAFAGPVVLA